MQTTREQRLKDRMNAAHRDVLAFRAIGAGHGHTITFGAGYWQTVALLPTTHPLERRIGEALIGRYSLAREQWRSHVEFKRAMRQWRCDPPRSEGSDEPWDYRLTRRPTSPASLGHYPKASPT